MPPRSRLDGVHVAGPADAAAGGLCPRSRAQPRARLGAPAAPRLRDAWGHSLSVVADRPVALHDGYVSRRRSSPAGDAAGGLFTALSVVGLTGGLYWGAKRPLGEPAESCSSHAADAVGKCFGDSLVETLTPYVIGAGTGLIAGGVLAYAIVIAAGVIRRLHRPSASTPRNRPVAPPRAMVALASAPHPAGRSMRARYSGRCSACQGSIRPGDRITHLGPRNNRCATCT